MGGAVRAVRELGLAMGRVFGLLDRVMNQGWAFFFFWWVLAGFAVSEEFHREALVMGVGDYGGASYKGKLMRGLPGITTVDLPLMKEKLESLGFRVRMVSDPTLGEAKREVDAFSARIRERPGVSLFYFSGHGGEYGGGNYLIPRGASMGSAADLEEKALNAQRVLNGMEESGSVVNLVFLDCCREDLGKSVGGAELAPLRARGSFVGFATRSGDLADSEEKGSPYTRYLLRHLGTPGVSVADMYAAVIADVKSYSKRVLGDERRPGFYSELDAPFYFLPGKPRVGIGDGGGRPAGGVVAAGELERASVGRVLEVPVLNGVQIRFCYCPPGKFTMGSEKAEVYELLEKEMGSFFARSSTVVQEPNQSRETVPGKVAVAISRGFWLGETEVTQAQWEVLMGSNPSRFKGAGLPVEQVSWEDAMSLLGRLHETVRLPKGWRFALPTEAQWEYACRAGTQTTYSFGSRLSKEDANYDGVLNGKTVPVGSYRANQWGFRDMHGNVSEWCSSIWSERILGGRDPVGAPVGAFRVVRGGGWKSGSTGCRAAWRYGYVPSFRSNGEVGFRIALLPDR